MQPAPVRDCPACSLTATGTKWLLSEAVCVRPAESAMQSAPMRSRFARGLTRLRLLLQAARFYDKYIEMMATDGPV